MIKWLLRLNDVQTITDSQWYLRLNWPKIVLLLAVIAAGVYVVMLYRRERTLRRRRRALLASLRTAIFAVILLLLFEPVVALSTVVELPRTVLVLVDASDSMNIRDDRQRVDDRKAAAFGLGKIAHDQLGGDVPPRVLEESARASRLELAKALLKHPTANVFQQLAQNYQVRYFTFGEQLEPPKGKGETSADKVQDMTAEGRFTRLGTALDEVTSRFSGQSISGVILLTDGAANGPVKLAEIAERMKERATPVFPVGLGLAYPPDIRLDAVIVPETVFIKDEVPVRVQLSSTGFANRRAEVVLKLNGRETASQTLKLTGEAQFAQLIFKPEVKADAADLSVEVRPVGLGAAPGEGGPLREASEDNNQISRTVRVLDQKIKVLYVEGKPRWEYRYLRRVLLRDHRLDVKFLMAEGDKELALHGGGRYLMNFPLERDQAFAFDLVIIGDVPRKNLTLFQMQRIAELVREQGGSFLMLAGMEYAPVSYVGTPLADLLPVRARADGWEPVGDMIHPAVTPEGTVSAVVSLEFPERENSRLWSQVRPMYQLPRLDGIKPGATVLLELSQAKAPTAAMGQPRENYPLVAWQRYGRGRTMYVGTDQLWRLRFKQGDKYHARFWGQAIRFLTLSRLLGGNTRIRLETGRSQYRQEERVQISANVLDEAYSPIIADAFDVILQRQGPQMETFPVRLEPVEGMPGLFQGFFVPKQAGRYELRAPDAGEKVANTVQINVEAVALERREPAMQEEDLKMLAERSGGKYFRVTDVPQLTEKLAGEPRITTARFTKELFDLPVLFVLLLVLMGAEWLLRRRFDLV